MMLSSRLLVISELYLVAKYLRRGKPYERCVKVNPLCALVDNMFENENKVCRKEPL